MYIEDNQLVQILECRNGREVWLALQNPNHKQATANKLILKREFSSFTYASTSIEEHLLAFQKLTVDMAASGCRPTEDDRVTRLMEILPSENDALIAAINVSTQMPPQEISLNYLIGAIKSETLRIGEKITKPKVVALNATKMTKFVKKKIDKKNVTCFNCNQKGHFKSVCPKIKREDAKNGTQVNGDEYSFVALHSDTVTGQSATWIIDSHASNHMTT
jgi:hypothetical protein